MIRTRFCLLSDTHAAPLFPSHDQTHGFKAPLPKADVLIHSGDLTEFGEREEHETTFEVVKSADAELKLVIAGNHDLTLDASFYAEKRRRLQVPEEDLVAVRNIWCGEEAKKANIFYMDEGVHTFTLKSGAKFTVFASPYTPEFGDWAFPYKRRHDRWSSSAPGAEFQAPNPIPSFPAIDICITHGPPYSILDVSKMFKPQSVGCQHLFNAMKRVRPRLHVFGHIHEGHGAKRLDWENEKSKNAAPESMQADLMLWREGYREIDVSSRGEELQHGKETLFVNAAIMDMHHRPKNAPWVVELDLPAA
jgi:Icc-related predicted phosphoesterase